MSSSRGHPFLSKNSGEMIFVGGISDTSNPAQHLPTLYRDSNIQLLSFKKSGTEPPIESSAPPEELSSLPHPSFPILCETDFNRIANVNAVSIPEKDGVTPDRQTDTLNHYEFDDNIDNDRLNAAIYPEDPFLSRRPEPSSALSSFKPVFHMKPVERGSLVNGIRRLYPNLFAEYEVQKPHYEEQTSILNKNDTSENTTAQSNPLEHCENSKISSPYQNIAEYTQPSVSELPVPQMIPGTIDFNELMTVDLEYKERKDSEENDVDGWCQIKNIN